MESFRRNRGDDAPCTIALRSCKIGNNLALVQAIANYTGCKVLAATGRVDVPTPDKVGNKDPGLGSGHDSWGNPGLNVVVKPNSN